MAMEAEWYRKQGHEVVWNIPNWQKQTTNRTLSIWDRIITEPEDLPFLELPHPDRNFTRWWKYQDNGNFKYKPATYIQSARDCWWHKCTFCRWAKKYPKYEVREVEDVISEIDECQKMGFREIFDDSGTFPIGEWLDEFCNCMISSERNKKVVLGCNMRIVDIDYEMMKRAGFRMLLIGVESANEVTLEKINKGIRVENIIPFFKKISKIKLELHASAIIGFPWETYDDTMRTINLIKYLLVKGYAKTAQMSFYSPPLGQEPGNEKYQKYITKFYEVGFNPLFWWNKIFDIKSMADLHYLIKSIQKGFSALLTRRLT